MHHGRVHEPTHRAVATSAPPARAIVTVAPRRLRIGFVRASVAVEVNRSVPDGRRECGVGVIIGGPEVGPRAVVGFVPVV